jgi:hypothetical protein
MELFWQCSQLPAHFKGLFGFYYYVKEKFIQTELIIIFTHSIILIQNPSLFPFPSKYRTGPKEAAFEVLINFCAKKISSFT